MKPTFSKNELKKIAKQVSINHLPLDELEDFCHRYHHLEKSDLTSLIWKEFGVFGEVTGKKGYHLLYDKRRRVKNISGF